MSLNDVRLNDARRFRAVAWDIDGTLIDSEPLHHRALVAICGELGADLSDLPDQAFCGTHIRDVWKILRPRLPDSTVEAEWIAAINSFYVENRAELMLLPGAVATIRTLAGRGVAQACVSNSSRRVVDANIDALGIADKLAFSISLDDVEHGKPDPEPYARACARLGLPPAQVVAVEDSLAGARAARAAGLHVIGYGSAAFDDIDHAIDAIDQVLALFPPA